MIYKTIKLKDSYNLQGGELTVYSMDYPYENSCKWERPALIVVPGGAYAFVSKREWEPVVMEFLARGFQVFALNYLVAPIRYPEQLLELACSVDYIRKNAKEFSVNPKQVFAVGFSAGGHLVGNLSVNNGAVPKYYKGKLDYLLTASCLCYPVISCEFGHSDSHRNLLGDNYSEQSLIEETSLDKQVNPKSTPSFIWSTFEDDLVNCNNSLNYAIAMKNNNVMFELHIYPEGEHGLSTCAEEINYKPRPYLDKNAKWLEDCTSFFRLFCKK